MPDQQPHFTFKIQGFDKDTFHVVRFTGTEGLSKLYQFELTVLSEKTSIDFEQALSGTATFTIKRQGITDLTWHGILRDFQQLQRADKHVFYRALLVPKAWELTQTQHNQIFLNMDMPQFLQQCLTDGGLSPGLDFEVNATGNYPKREYVCQYNETHFNFASRWMERNGFYFFFDQSGSQEKMMVADSLNVHTPHPGGGILKYAEPTGLDSSLTGQAAKNFYCEQRRLPKEVLLKDYNYRTPELDIQVKEQVSEKGSGTVYMHGGHLRSPTEAANQAKVRAQELKCREKLFFGESNAPFLQPGYTFTLQNHYRNDFNQSYLLIEVKHEGAQESWLTAGLGTTGLGDKLFYRNGFVAIPANVQFRSEQKTPAPRIEGTLSAVIDAEGSGQYAELDDQGRYKVIMPFDLSGRKEGHASAWLRMIQPYAGSGHGMHFPLHKGTEVAVIHHEGDPDRPIIAGAVPNPLTQSMVTSNNQTQSRITTSGGNLIHIEDQEGSQRILLSSPTQQSFVRIGSHNDPDDPKPPAEEKPPSYKPTKGNLGSSLENWEWAESPDGLKLCSVGPITIKAQESFETILGNENVIVFGVSTSSTIGAEITFVLGGLVEYQFPSKLSYSSAETHLKGELSKIYATQTEVAASQNTIVDEILELVDERTDIQNNKIALCATKQELTTAKTQIGATMDANYATKEELTATKSALTSDLEFICLVAEHTFATKEELTATKSEVSGEVNQVRGELTTQSGQITSMAGDVSNLWGVVNVVAGEVGFV
ncbi:MAG: type VI secretion system tip protein VgrG [Desulfovibrio sp.]|nr:type VI secretion system tip protein VgrG [Desulfovibrio sp.]MBI4959095.1 type VI secretion system tip protein VgrG [Desulfovibrio sp.]